MPAHPYLEPPYTFNELRKAKKKEVIGMSLIVSLICLRPTLPVISRFMPSTHSF